MQEFKGTPGPWSLRVTGAHWNNPKLQNIEINYGTDGECICDTVYEIEDAHLIAAAPELLEALIMVRDADNDCVKDGLPTIPAPARSRIDRAIAKALNTDTTER